MSIAFLLRAYFPCHMPQSSCYPPNTHSDHKGWQSLPLSLTIASRVTFHDSRSLFKSSTPRFFRPHWHCMKRWPPPSAKLPSTSTTSSQSDTWQTCSRQASVLQGGHDGRCCACRMRDDDRAVDGRSHTRFLVLQGLLMSAPDTVNTPAKWGRLWLHESERVYADRLVSAAVSKQGYMVPRDPVNSLPYAANTPKCIAHWE